MTLPSSFTSAFAEGRFEWLKRSALTHLEAVVAVDSCSDERSETVPSSEGQVKLTALLRTLFEGLGAEVEVDEYANIIARYSGRGEGVNAPPIALMIHLDTAHGTRAISKLLTHPTWDGSPLTLPAQPSLVVSEQTYPSLSTFLGHTLVHGPGDAPFGLDDKLGLTHLLSLATLLSEQGEAEGALEGVSLPPVWLIGRPDEEIGRDDALIGLAQRLKAGGVRRGYTVDGIEPFEVNVANFFGAQASVTFEPLTPQPSQPTQSTQARLPEGLPLALTLGGVNTHGATAHAEGHRSALRWLAELWRDVKNTGVRLCAYLPSEERECDGVIHAWAPDITSAAQLRAAVKKHVEPHIPRGASVRFEELEVSDEGLQADPTLERLASWLGRVLFEAHPTPAPLLAEDSAGWEGYSHPASLERQEGGAWRLDWRLRDFDLEALETRAAWLEAQHATEAQAEFSWRRQYDNMASRLEEAPELVRWAEQGARALGLNAEVRPIRGGTGVDPFLDAGVMVANLGTGYFSPESEKELTSLELMRDHALWLVALLNQSLHQALSSAQEKP